MVEADIKVIEDELREAFPSVYILGSEVDKENRYVKISEGVGGIYCQIEGYHVELIGMVCENLLTIVDTFRKHGFDVISLEPTRQKYRWFVGIKNKEIEIL